jgi:hypothetical protein
MGLLLSPGIALLLIGVLSGLALWRRTTSRGDGGDDWGEGHGPTPSWCLELARRGARPLLLLRLAVRHASDVEIAAAARLSRGMLNGVLRLTDVIAEVDRQGCITIACPDTDAAGIARLIDRLAGALDAEGYRAAIGWASFPADGFTLASLLEQADARLRDDLQRPWPDRSSSASSYVRSAGARS